MSLKPNFGPPPVPPNPFSGNPYDAPRALPPRKKAFSVPLILQLVVGGVSGIVIAFAIVSLIRQSQPIQQAQRQAQRQQRQPETRPQPRVADPIKKTTRPVIKTKSVVPIVVPEPEKHSPPVPQRKARIPVVPPVEEPNTLKPDHVALQLDILLESPDPKLRLAAARELRKPHLRDAFEPQNVERLILGLADISPDVQLEVVELLGELGDAAALSGLVKYRERSEVSDKLKGQAAVSILRIAPNSPEANKAFAPYLVGNGARVIKPLPQPALAIRIEACQYLSKYGASAKWSEPILLDILAVTARNLDGQNGIKAFEAACDAIGRLDSHQPETIKKLEQFVAGKGFISKREENLTQAKILADSAFRIATKSPKLKEARVSTKPKEQPKVVRLRPRVETKAVSARVTPTKDTPKMKVYSLKSPVPC